MVAHAFERGVHRVSLELFAFNPRAERAYEKAGFTVEGGKRDALFWEGEYHDVILMARLQGSGPLRAARPGQESKSGSRPDLVCHPSRPGVQHLRAAPQHQRRLAPQPITVRRPGYPASVASSVKDNASRSARSSADPLSVVVNICRPVSSRWKTRGSVTW